MTFEGWKQRLNDKNRADKIGGKFGTNNEERISFRFEDLALLAVFNPYENFQRKSEEKNITNDSHPPSTSTVIVHKRENRNVS